MVGGKRGGGCVGSGEGVGQLAKRGMLARVDGDGGVGCGRGRVLEGTDEIAGGGGGGVSAGGCGHGDLGGEPDEGVGDGLGGGGGGPAAVAAVVLHRWTKVPAIFGVWRPGGTETWFLVNLDVSAGWGKRGAIEVKRSM